MFDTNTISQDLSSGSAAICPVCKEEISGLSLTKKGALTAASLRLLQAHEDAHKVAPATFDLDALLNELSSIAAALHDKGKAQESFIDELISKEKYARRMEESIITIEALTEQAKSFDDGFRDDTLVAKLNKLAFEIKANLALHALGYDREKAGKYISEHMPQKAAAEKATAGNRADKAERNRERAIQEAGFDPNILADAVHGLLTFGPLSKPEHLFQQMFWSMTRANKAWKQLPADSRPVKPAYLVQEAKKALDYVGLGRKTIRYTDADGRKVTEELVPDQYDRVAKLSVELYQKAITARWESAAQTTVEKFYAQYQLSPEALHMGAINYPKYASNGKKGNNSEAVPQGVAPSSIFGSDPEIES